MFRTSLAAAFALLSFGATAADYEATTTANVALRHAPGPTYAQIGVIPAATPVAVDVCFDKGAYCLVKWSGQPSDGFVAGELLTIGLSGQTVLAAEQEKWTQLANRPSKLPEFKDFASFEIRTEGDSYMSGAYQVILNKMIAGRTGRPVINTAKGGSSMDLVLERMRDPANAKYLGDTTVIWDGATNDARSPEDYVSLIGEAVGLLGHERFIIIPPGPRGEPSPGLANAIGDLIKATWPDNYLDWRPFIPIDGTLFPADQLARPAEDRVHLGETPMRAMSQQIAAFITQKGW